MRARIFGTVSGRAWSGYQASLNIDAALDHKQGFKLAVERLVRAQGDFESCLIDPDTVIEVSLTRQYGDRYREYARVFPVTRFPSIAQFVRRPK